MHDHPTPLDPRWGDGALAAVEELFTLWEDTCLLVLLAKRSLGMRPIHGPVSDAHHLRALLRTEPLPALDPARFYGPAQSSPLLGSEMYIGPARALGAALHAWVASGRPTYALRAPLQRTLRGDIDALFTSDLHREMQTLATLRLPHPGFVLRLEQPIRLGARTIATLLVARLHLALPDAALDALDVWGVADELVGAHLPLADDERACAIAAESQAAAIALLRGREDWLHDRCRLLHSVAFRIRHEDDPAGPTLRGRLVGRQFHSLLPRPGAPGTSAGSEAAARQALSHFEFEALLLVLGLAGALERSIATGAGRATAVAPDDGALRPSITCGALVQELRTAPLRIVT